jgi:hypothetical protein
LKSEAASLAAAVSEEEEIARSGKGARIVSSGHFWKETGAEEKGS